MTASNTSRFVRSTWLLTAPASSGDAALHADLVVGADGVHSWVRAQRWPDAAAPVYSGSTTWRAVTTPSAAVTEMSLSWGLGTQFGVMPIVDGRTYWYAAANADEGQRNPDELRERRCRRLVAVRAWRWRPGPD